MVAESRELGQDPTVPPTDAERVKARSGLLAGSAKSAELMNLHCPTYMSLSEESKARGRQDGSRSKSKRRQRGRVAVMTILTTPSAAHLSAASSLQRPRVVRSLGVSSKNFHPLHREEKDTPLLHRHPLLSTRFKNDESPLPSPPHNPHARSCFPFRPPFARLAGTGTIGVVGPIATSSITMCTTPPSPAALPRLTFDTTLFSIGTVTASVGPMTGFTIARGGSGSVYGLITFATPATTA